MELHFGEFIENWAIRLNRNLVKIPCFTVLFYSLKFVAVHVFISFKSLI